jgi:hypothetical protein
MYEVPDERTQVLGPLAATWQPTGNVTVSPLLGPTIALTGGVPRVQTRVFVTMDYLWTARHAAKLCGRLERQLLRNDPQVEHRTLAMTAVFFGAAFLEALVNEVILDLIDPPPGGPSARVEGIPADANAIAVIRAMWRRSRPRASLLDKYNETLAAVAVNRAKAVPYTENRDPYRSAELLIQFRNHLVHFKPKTRDIHTDHEFETRFKNAKIVENQQDIGKPWFPNKALGAGLAEWACESSSRFAKSWWGRIGIRRSFDDEFNQLGPY